MFGFIGSPSREELVWWGSHCVMDMVGHAALLLNMKTTLLRADADRLLDSGSGGGSPAVRTPERIEAVMALVRRAQAVLDELGRWVQQQTQGGAKAQPAFGKAEAGCAADDAAELRPLEHAVAFPGGRLFRFANVWVAAKHVNTDASRVLLAGIVTRCLAWVSGPGGDATRTTEWRAAAAAGTDAVENVVAAVPYFLAWTGDLVTTPLFPCGTPETPKGFAGISCLYPLFATALSPFATPRQKRYLYGRLNWISESMGIKPAGAFASVSVPKLSRS